MFEALKGRLTKAFVDTFGDWTLGSFGDLLCTSQNKEEVATNPHMDVARKFKTLYTPEVVKALDDNAELGLADGDVEFARQEAVEDLEWLFTCFYDGKQCGLSLRDLSNAVFLNMREVGDSRKEMGRGVPTQKDFDRFWLFTEQLLVRYGVLWIDKPKLMSGTPS